MPPKPTIQEEDLIANLLSAANENSAAIADSLEKVLTDRINFGTEDEALLAIEIEIGWRLKWPLQTIARLRREVLDTWESATSRIFNNCSSRIAFLSTKYFFVCRETVLQGKASMRDLLDHYGFEGLFHQTQLTLFPEDYFAPLIEEFSDELKFAIYSSKEPRQFINWIKGLKEISQVALVSPPPWIVHPPNWQGTGEYFFRSFSFQKEDTQLEDLVKAFHLDNDALFGLFVLMALSLEFLDNKVDVIEHQLASLPSVLFPFRSILIARLEPDKIDLAQAAIDACSFTAEQQEFIQRWMRKEFDLILLETPQEEADEEMNNFR